MNRFPQTTDRGQLQHNGDGPQPPRRRSLGARFLGWTLLTLSVGLVSCQSMFVL